MKTTLASRIKARILQEYMDKPFTIDMLMSDLKGGDIRPRFVNYINNLTDKRMAKIKAVGNYTDPADPRKGGSAKRIFVVVDREFFETPDEDQTPKSRYLKKAKDDEEAAQALLASGLALQRICLGWGCHA